MLNSATPKICVACKPGCSNCSSNKDECKTGKCD
jgi:hypothetical protein